MFRIVSLACGGIALLVGATASIGPANAVVYCKTEGVPRGCVIRPDVVAPVVVAPAAVARPVVVAPVDAAVVACRRRGLARGCVVR